MKRCPRCNGPLGGEYGTARPLFESITCLHCGWDANPDELVAINAEFRAWLRAKWLAAEGLDPDDPRAALDEPLPA